MVNKTHNSSALLITVMGYSTVPICIQVFFALISFRHNVIRTAIHQFTVITSKTLLLSSYVWVLTTLHKHYRQISKLGGTFTYSYARFNVLQVHNLN